MAFADLLHGRGSTRRFSARISQVSDTFAGKVRGFYLSSRSLKVFATRRFSGVGLILTALVLAFWAHDFARIELDSEWQRKHPPSEKVLSWVLGSYGFLRVPEGKRLDWLKNKAPIGFEESGSFFLTQDGNWVSTGVSKEEGIEIQLFFRSKKKALPGKEPAQWREIGRGWKGLEALQKTLDDQPNRGAPTRREATSVRRDPRELIY